MFNEFDEAGFAWSTSKKVWLIELLEYLELDRILVLQRKHERNLDRLELLGSAVGREVVAVGDAVVVPFTESLFDLRPLKFDRALVTPSEALAVEGQGRDKQTFNDAVCFPIWSLRRASSLSQWPFVEPVYLLKL